ncbi:putative F-box/LRR-repeat protein 23 isoform X2 [Magnolia sinica]|nr:putative F-box/LRR-repeat protein 23 isoform X2 [Magnolia sinica]XP_058099068.1 putative F-box/LRR-repeat protein 23 isoform X2 [Magnolia sinica]
MRSPWDLYNDEDGLEKMARNAVDRSEGQLVEFSVEYFGTDKLLQYVIERVSILRCLRLIRCYSISNEGIIEVAKKIPHLEELDISYCSFPKEVLENVGQLCPRLKSLRLNCQGYKRPHIECDEEALAIAANMPELRHLQLMGNKLTDYGLRAILDGCPHLESLDLRQCYSVNLDGGLHKRCVDRIKHLMLPNDSTVDCVFDAEIDEYGSDYDEGYPSGFSEIDILSDDEYYEFSDVDVFSDFEF